MHFGNSSIFGLYWVIFAIFCLTLLFLCSVSADKNVQFLEMKYFIVSAVQRASGSFYLWATDVCQPLSVILAWLFSTQKTD